MNIREVLAANLLELRNASITLKSGPPIHQAGGPANGTFGRIMSKETGATIDTLKLLGDVFGVKPWQLLLPGLKAKSNSTNHPILIGIPGWPFPLVDQKRYDRLSPEEQGFVQGKLITFIEEIEKARPKSSLKPVK